MLDSLCKVRDGSTGEITTGYHLLEITALTKGYKIPMPVYTRVYSGTEKDYVSEDEEVLGGLKYISKHFGKSGIRTMDRGYDSCEYYRYFIKHNENFIICAKKNRDVRYKGETINILELANRYKGKYRITFKDNAYSTYWFDRYIFGKAGCKYFHNGDNKMFKTDIWSELYAY
jgi:hypothetical protein